VLYSFGGGKINFFDFSGFFFIKSFLILIADIDRPVLGISRLLLYGVKFKDESSRTVMLDLRALIGAFTTFFVVYGYGLPILSSIS
jgi:hypothetical protein